MAFIDGIDPWYFLLVLTHQAYKRGEKLGIEGILDYLLYYVWVENLAWPALLLISGRKPRGNVYVVDPFRIHNWASISYMFVVLCDVLIYLEF